MVKLTEDKASINVSTFRSTDVTNRFLKKYKGIKGILKLRTIQSDNAILITTADLTNKEQLESVVKDHGNLTDMTLKIYSKDDLETVSFKQFPGFCGTAIVYFSNIELKSKEELSYTEDLLYSMGYISVMISSNPFGATRYASDLSKRVPYSEWATENGYTAFMNCTNRRTNNNISFYYKQLKSI